MVNLNIKYHNVHLREFTLVHLGGNTRDVCPPRSNFFHFHAVFGKNLAKNYIFGSNSKVGAPPLPYPSGKSWIRHWFTYLDHNRFRFFQPDTHSCIHQHNPRIPCPHHMWHCQVNIRSKVSFLQIYQNNVFQCCHYISKRLWKRSGNCND